MVKKRDYKAEYRRRRANARARGLSLSQARGHARAGEAPSRGPPRQIADDRLQIALRVLRQEKNFEAAAKAAGISPERLRRHAVERGLIEKSKRRWQPRADLPRRLKIFSRGKALTIIVPDFASASQVGRHMSAVGAFLRTNNPAGLREFEGVGVADTSGTIHAFETRPNALYRLASANDQSFEHIYRIVI